METASFYRFAVAAAIVLALTVAAVASVNYVLNVVHQHQVEVEVAAANAATQSRIEATERQAQADAEAARLHQDYLNATAVVSLANHATATLYLWTATPSGTNADGSSSYVYNAACGARPGESCSANVYVHRGVQVRGANSSWSADNPNWAWQVVPEEGLALEGHDVKF